MGEANRDNNDILMFFFMVHLAYLKVSFECQFRQDHIKIKLLMSNQVGEDIGGSIEVYDPGLNQWRMQGTMQDARLVFDYEEDVIEDNYDDNDHDDDDQERAGSASRSRPAPPSSCSGAEQEMEPQVGHNDQDDRDDRDYQVVADHGQLVMVMAMAIKR